MQQNAVMHNTFCSAVLIFSSTGTDYDGNRWRQIYRPPQLL